MIYLHMDNKFIKGTYGLERGRIFFSYPLEGDFFQNVFNMYVHC